jgi:Glycosyl hydrolases family 43
MRWTDRGYLFNPRSGAWQARCNSLTLSCYRPHVLFNQWTGKYVLWVNAYDVPNGYHVLTSDSPMGPFTEIKQPVLATTRGGDMDLFQDEDGVAYIATTLRPGYRLGIEELDRDYTSGTGRKIELPFQGVEAPSLFKRNSRYYLTFSDPGCAYCAGTGTSYVTANSILGRWSARTTLHQQSCGGQPADVAELTIGGRRWYLYQSDRWNRRNPNEALAGQHWELLRFDESGGIRPLTCAARQAVPGLTTGPAPDAGNPQVAAWSAPASWTCDLKAGKSVSQTFKVEGAGRLTSIRTVLFRQRMYGKTLRVAVHRTKAGRPVGKPIWRASVPAGRLSWAPTTATLHMRVKVRRNATLALVLTGKGKRSTKGCFGFVTRQPVGAGAARNAAQLWQRRSPSTHWKKRSGLMPIAATVS